MSRNTYDVKIKQEVLEMYEQHHNQAAIARRFDIPVTTVNRWVNRNLNNLPVLEIRTRKRKLSNSQLLKLGEIIKREVAAVEAEGGKWVNSKVLEIIKREFGVSYHPQYVGKVVSHIGNLLLTHSSSKYFETKNLVLYLGDAKEVLSNLPSASVDCIVTSPPYYGQRDYGVAEQIGLEDHPDKYISKLVDVFQEAMRVLKPSGSLWVNIGDTYWSGKGMPQGADPKQKHRRFKRPQDYTGQGPLCRPKQLLLIPHRFAIAMQEIGWIVRNDNVWYKVNPTPDPAIDRCASAHEYVFHFVLNKRYYFNFDSVAVPSNGKRNVKSPPSVWQIPVAPNFKKHIAVFPESLVKLPILATLPLGGTLLDPFCGSGTALNYALKVNTSSKVLGIDISHFALDEAKLLLT